MSPAAAHDHVEHENEHEHHGQPDEPIIVTLPPPVKTTTLRAIIHPESEKFHAHGNVKISFGNQEHQERKESGRQISEYKNEESALQPVVAHPNSPNSVADLSQKEINQARVVNSFNPNQVLPPQRPAVNFHSRPPPFNAPQVPFSHPSPQPQFSSHQVPPTQFSQQQFQSQPPPQQQFAQNFNIQHRPNPPQQFFESRPQRLPPPPQRFQSPSQPPKNSKVTFPEQRFPPPSQPQPHQHRPIPIPIQHFHNPQSTFQSSQGSFQTFSQPPQQQQFREPPQNFNIQEPQRPIKTTQIRRPQLPPQQQQTQQQFSQQIPSNQAPIVFNHQTSSVHQGLVQQPAPNLAIQNPQNLEHSQNLQYVLPAGGEVVASIPQFEQHITETVQTRPVGIRNENRLEEQRFQQEQQRFQEHRFHQEQQRLQDQRVQEQRIQEQQRIQDQRVQEQQRLQDQRNHQIFLDQRLQQDRRNQEQQNRFQSQRVQEQKQDQHFAPTVTPNIGPLANTIGHLHVTPAPNHNQKFVQREEASLLHHQFTQTMFNPHAEAPLSPNDRERIPVIHHERPPQVQPLLDQRNNLHRQPSQSSPPRKGPHSVSNRYQDLFPGQPSHQGNFIVSQQPFPSNHKPESSFSHHSTRTKSSTTTTTPAPKTTSSPKTESTTKKDYNIVLPDEVPDDLRQQLLSSGILENADISVLDYDKIGDTSLQDLPPEHLANFFSHGGAAQIAGSDQIETVVKPNGEKVAVQYAQTVKSRGTEKYRNTEKSLPKKEKLDLKVVRFDSQKSVDKFIDPEATILPAVDTTEQAYNRYLPLKIAGAHFPIPDAPELKGRRITEVVVLAPVDNPSEDQAASQESERQERDAILDSKQIKFVAGDALKQLIKKPSTENYKRWLEKEGKTEVDLQSVVLLVTK